MAKTPIPIVLQLSEKLIQKNPIPLKRNVEMRRKTIFILEDKRPILKVISPGMAVIENRNPIWVSLTLSVSTA
jgi:hypothetical protein